MNMTLHSTGSRGKKKRNDAEKENESPLKIQKIDAGKAVDATPLEMLASEGKVSYGYFYNCFFQTVLCIYNKENLI